MFRTTFTSLVSRGLRTIDSIAAPKTAHAHCDIPCGIYDPHLAQIGALSVMRMDQLIEALEAPAADAAKDVTAQYHNQMARYVAVKEEHAELVKREVRVIWGDYFKPEHVEKFTDLHDVAFKLMKAAGKTRASVATADAQDLLAQVQRFAEIFWETKGVKTKRQPSNQAVGGELVVAAN